jgi:hypothetical protein
VSQRKLALLITPVKPGEPANVFETAMLNDLALVRRALQRRGFQAGEILCLQERVTPQALRAFLAEASKRTASWSDGEVFLFYSGNGHFRHAALGDPRPGLHLSGGDMLWDEVFSILNLPSGVHLTLLADCCHNNLLAGRVLANVTALIQVTRPGQELVCQALCWRLPANGVTVPHGVISYYAARALELATTVDDWLRLTVALCSADVQGGVLPPTHGLSLTLAGTTGRQLPGRLVK